MRFVILLIHVMINNDSMIFCLNLVYYKINVDIEVNVGFSIYNQY